MKKTPLWTDEELMSTVRAYLDMLHLELNGSDYNKTAVNRKLREGSLRNRTKGSIEFRMQNISAALYDLKMPWIQGYLPARNIGSSVKEKIISLLKLCEIGWLFNFVPTLDPAELEKKVSVLRKEKYARIPPGIGKPTLIEVTSRVYVRDPAVKAYILDVADGRCEGCGGSSPFLGDDGLPYLEVHHVTPLSCFGSDTVTNAVALCPNCHRRCHFSTDRDEFKIELYQRIPRLIVEVSEPVDLSTE